MKLKVRLWGCLFLIFMNVVPALFAGNESQTAVQEVKLQLKWVHQFEFAGYYAAIEKGYYSELGIHVDLLLPDGQLSPVEKVVKGEADFGITSSDILLARSKNKKLVVLSSIFQHSPNALLVSAASGITNPRHLSGKTIALESDSAEIIAFLEQASVFPGIQDIKPLKYNAIQLLNGETDAISSYITDEPFLLDSLGFKYNVLIPMSGGIDFYGDLLFTSEKLIAENPELVANFRKASLRGWKYAMDHPFEIVDLIRNKYGQQHTKDHLIFEMEKMKDLIWEDFVEIGYSNPDRWEKILKVYQEMGLIDPDFTIDGLLYEKDYQQQAFVFPWKLVGIFLLILTSISTLAYVFYKSSKNLRREINSRQKIEKELSESEALYRSVLTASPDTIVIADLEGKIRFASPMVTQMLGYSLNDILNRSVFDYLDQKDHARAHFNMQQMFQHNFIGSTEYIGHRFDGTNIDIEINGEFIRDAEDQPVSIVFVIRDISARKTAESKLRKSEETYRKLVEAIHDVIYEISDVGILKYVSPSIERILGLKPEEILGKNFLDFVFDADKLILAEKFATLTHKVNPSLDYRLVGKDGRVCWVRSSTTPVYQDGIMVGGTGSLYDITEKRRAEELLKDSERQVVLLLNSIAEGVYGTDLEGNCTFVNPSCAKLLGYADSNELLGKNMHNLIHHSYPDGKAVLIADCEIDQSFRKGIQVNTDREFFWRADGTVFPVEYWAFPQIENGEIVGSVVTFVDITDRKRAENDIHDLNATLERRIQERTIQLEETNENLLTEIEERKRAEIEMSKAKGEAEKANIAKSEFLSRMSHELRTPMNAILGFAQLMEMGELGYSQRKSVNHILSSGKHLLDLINEVLDITRIESGYLSLSMEPIQLSEIIHEMIETIRPLSRENQVTVELLNSPVDQLFVKSDRQRLKQVLLNLINNGVKYNHRGGSVMIRTEQKNNGEIEMLRISIQDTGVGISPENIKKLYNPFERIGADQTGVEGSGLGLVVVKKLVDAMGGLMGVESMPGAGSTFWIELPQIESQLESIQKSGVLGATTSGLTNKTGTVLYIEDNISNIDLVEQILSSQRSDIGLVTQMNGKKAVQSAIDHTPDLILLDLDLPDIHGSEVLRLLQAEERTKAIPVIIISADAMTNQIEKLLNSGAKNYLTKPIEVIVFLSVIDEYV